LRLLATVVVSATALVAAGAGSSAPSAPAAAAARVCKPKEVAVNIQILGDRTWGWVIGRYRAIPERVTTIVVWSKGGPAETQGVAAYGWATRTRSAFFAECAPGRAARQPAGNLGTAVRVKDGWFAGRKYTCIETGRIVVAISDTRSGKRVTVRVQKTGKLLALGEITKGGGWLRGSKSCRESEK
jgi:hypothetical protein